MSYSDQLLIINARILLEDGVVDQAALHIDQGRIAWVGTQQELSQAQNNGSIQTPGQIIDAKGGWLLPGFIDIHVHGGSGADFMGGTEQAFDEITTFHGRHGTTSMLATTVTASKTDIEGVLQATSRYITGPMPGARLLGVHLEGPFISHKWPGAQNPAHIVSPNLSWIQDWVQQYPDVIRMLTLAPEEEGALELIEWLSAQGIVSACGHTNATYEQIIEAVGHGLRHAVHTFNAMTPLHHRAPGTVGAVMSDDRMSAEIIADGHHVHAGAIRLLERSKPDDKLILITDAVMAAGLGDGEYDLGGLPITVKDGVARLTGGDSLAGSTLTMINGFRYMVNQAGVSVEKASRMASANPARLLGLYEQTGSIANGKLADLVLVSQEPELKLQRVWSAGNPIYQASAESDK